MLLDDAFKPNCLTNHLLTAYNPAARTLLG